MTINKPSMWLAACCLVAALTASASAQFDYLGPDSDLQFFSPVDFDFDDQAIRKQDGWFFRYDKLSWAMTGDRTTIGNPDVNVLSEIIYDDNNPEDNGNRPPQYQIINGLRDVVPDAAFSWGERYEFGTMNKNGGYLIGILDGPEVNQNQVFGSGPQTSGFGSIHINFATPPGYLTGFRDYFNNADNVAGIVTNGPGGMSPNGFPDDTDGDLREGIFTVFVDINGNGTQDDDEPTIAVAEDFDDVATFNVRFNQLNVRNTTETQGVEIMRFHEVDNSHKMKKRQNHTAGFGYGVRFLRIRDQFNFNGTSDFFRGLNNVFQESENQIVGPQIMGHLTSQVGRFRTEVMGRFVFGYNIQDIGQQGTWGENILTGDLNQSQIAQPTTWISGKRADYFSPVVELRANSIYQLSSSISLRLGYTAMFIDNVSRASQLVQYNLPDWGIGATGEQDIFVNGVNFGFDVVY